MEKRIRFWWDDNSEEPGWYAVEEHLEDGQWEPYDDSQKVWFPVSLDGFSEDQEDEAYEALEREFPEHEIVAK